MARIRSIKPEFFRHEGLYEAEREDELPLRIAFAGLWTAADREGRFRWSARQLKLDCLPYDDVDFSRVLDALATRGFIVKYAIDGREYGYIPTWHQHQIINNREKESDLPEPNETNILTRAPRVDDACPTRLEHAQGEGKGREGKGRDSPTRRDASKQNLEFEEFWKSYPARKGDNPKAPARKLFEAAVKQGADPKAIIAGVKAACQRNQDKIGTEFIPQAVKWLRDKRWEDYAGANAAPPANDVARYLS